MTDLGYFAYTAPDALSAAMDSSTTAVSLVSGSTFPDPAMPGIGQYTVLLAYGTNREEVCTVTAKPSGNILTVIRGEDGTLATAKNLGDIVVHGVSARDFNATVKVDDTRLADARTPVAHAATHAPGGSDPLTLAALGAQAYLPIGCVIMWYGSGSAPPPGWLVCTGGTFDQATYPALYALLGGTTLPSFGSKFPRGSSANSPRLFGGADSVTLTTAQMPSHSHSVGAYANSTPGDWASPMLSGGSGVLSSLASVPQGGGLPFDNRPSFFEIHFLIKAL